MSVTVADLKWNRSKTVTNTVANGGKMSIYSIITGVRNNVFPDVSEAERTVGLIRYRKLFLKVADADNTLFANCKIHMTTLTPADDWVSIFSGTQTDTQSSISSPTEYGIAAPSATINAGDSFFDVVLEDTSLEIFHNGGTIWISDDTNEEYHNNVTVSKSGSTYTITLEAGDQVANTFNLSNSFVASCIDASDVAPALSDFSVTSTIGTYNSDHIDLDNIGGIEETWTITFTSSTAFSCSGAEIGDVGTGIISSDFAPNNSDFTRPFFTLKTVGFGGTWVSGDTITFSTSPAAVPIWFKQVVPAGAASYSGNTFGFRVIGESA